MRSEPEAHESMGVAGVGAGGAPGIIWCVLITESRVSLGALAESTSWDEDVLESLLEATIARHGTWCSWSPRCHGAIPVAGHGVARA